MKIAKSLILVILTTLLCSTTNLEAKVRRAAVIESDVCTDLSAQDSTRTAGAQALRSISFSLGGSILAEGDELKVTRVQGCTSELEDGWVYLVEGHYTLSSRDEAILLVGTTATLPASSDTRSPKEPASVRIKRGQGTFRLPLHLFRGGKPHVTMYSVKTRRPFSGRYFGSGDSLLPRISWRYEQ